MRILLLEDDVEIGTWVEDGLSKAGHVIDWVKDGHDAFLNATTRDYNVIVLDRMTPGLDGLSVLKALRSTKNAVPVLFLTALGSVEDRVEGLDAGGDDYLPKPFAFSELLARVSALGRRPSSSSSETISCLEVEKFQLNLLKQQCTRAGQPVPLNAKEFRLFETFIRNKGRVLTKNMLLEKVWDMNFDPTSSVVETHISRLRAKIEKPFDIELIRTIRGAGYILDD